jgi:hypothetical protein
MACRAPPHNVDVIALVCQQYRLLRTNRNCMSRLVASSMKTSRVQGSPRSLEPAMFAAVDLNQFAIVLAA